jgi:hypothetical protein
MNEDLIFDIILDHKKTSLLTDEEVFKLLKNAFPERDLFSMSIYWREDKRYILKAQGTYGDVIVGWTENQKDGQNTVTHCPIF